MSTQPSETPAPSEVGVRSSRDLDAVRKVLEDACARHWPDASRHQVSGLEGTSANGMSSETLLFDLYMEGADGAATQHLVARVAPDPSDVPVFASYDLPGQFETIRTVAALTDVPVPRALWCEPDPAVIGAPFFVMGRVEGKVPPDVMPYSFGDNWLFDADRADQSRLQEATVSAIARLHAIENPTEHFAHLGGGAGATPLRRHVARTRAWYEWAALESGRSDLVEKGFAWLDEHWPSHEGDPVFSWGDSRIGNVLYQDFEPVAVLDWEMAAIGPSELDVGWLIYCHRMFEDMAGQFGFPGMPHFLTPDDVASSYERLTGRAPRDLDWYVAYSCLQLGIVFLRTGWRSVHFGEREAPAQTDDLLMNGPTLAALFSR